MVVCKRHPNDSRSLYWHLPVCWREGTRLFRRLNRRGRAELAGSFLGYIYNAWLTNFPSITVRLFYLRHILGYAIGKGSFVHMGCFFEGANVKIGKNAVVGRHCYLGGSGGTLAIKDILVDEGPNRTNDIAGV